MSRKGTMRAGPFSARACVQRRAFSPNGRPRLPSTRHTRGSTAPVRLASRAIQDHADEAIAPSEFQSALGSRAGRYAMAGLDQRRHGVSIRVRLTSRAIPVPTACGWLFAFVSIRARLTSRAIPHLRKPLFSKRNLDGLREPHVNGYAAKSGYWTVGNNHHKNQRDSCCANRWTPERHS